MTGRYLGIALGIALGIFICRTITALRFITAVLFLGGMLITAFACLFFTYFVHLDFGWWPALIGASAWALVWWRGWRPSSSPASVSSPQDS